MAPSRRALLEEGAIANSSALSEVLARFGFNDPIRAADFQSLFVQLREEQFDLVILDLQDLAPGQLLTLEREVRKNPNIFVIGTLPVADAEVILRAVRSGVNEFLLSGSTAEEIAGAIERLMWRTRSETARGELIAVYSAKGGLGTSAIAVNLAQSFGVARPDARVALADLVVAGGDVRLFLNVKTAYDISDLIAKGDRVDANLLNSLLTPVPGGVWVLPAANDPEVDEVFDAGSIRTILELLTSHFQITVVDCEHHLSERTLAALDAADRILVVTHLSVPALKSTQRTLSVFQRLGYRDDKLAIVVNRFHSADVLPPKEAEELLQQRIYWRIPNDYQASMSALNKGVPVVLNEPNSRLTRSYVDLALKLSGLPITAQTAEGGMRLRKFLGMNRGAKNVS